ncbi:MAG: hypothetical protein NUV56_04360 [Candidatus Uhrbacteria bacterium]|nr:hypothetical protein [Candidatus Uhrbacteria bacterium]
MVLNARPLLARLALGLWIAVDAVLLVFFAWQIIGYLVSGSFVELRQISSLGSNVGVVHESVSNGAAKDIVVGLAKVLKSSDTASDFYVVVENPNEDWYATFTYAFSWSDQQTDGFDGFVMPGESKYLLALNAKSDTRPTSADIIITDFVWHHVDRHDVADIESWLIAHENFVISEASHAADVDLAEDKVARSLFTVTNATSYAYWEPVFTVLLERNGVIVGLNQATLQQFEAGEARSVEVHWSGDVTISGTPNIIPSINFFDASAYMMPGGVQADDWRDVFGD